MKKTVIVGIILLVIIGCIFAAGCTSNEMSNSNEEIGSLNTEVYDELAGTWSGTFTSDMWGNVNSQYVLKNDGTGVRHLYSGESCLESVSMKWYPVASSADSPTSVKICCELNFGGDPKLSYFTTLGDNKNTLINGENGETLIKKSSDVRTTWIPPTSEDASATTPKVSYTKNPADYVEDGDYYLVDDNGRGFTETLWSGDIAPYVKEYKHTPSGSEIANYHAGKWIQYVRGLSKRHHSYESTSPVSYQTIDETMKKGSGTCDDLAILAARGLKELGYNVSILVFPEHMDIGISKDDYYKLKGQCTVNKYAAYQNAEDVIYDGYYYLNIADYQKSLDLGECVSQDGFTYDMTLKKLIVL